MKRALPALTELIADIMMGTRKSLQTLSISRAISSMSGRESMENEERHDGYYSNHERGNEKFPVKSKFEEKLNDADICLKIWMNFTNDDFWKRTYFLKMVLHVDKSDEKNCYDNDDIAQDSMKREEWSPMW